MPVEVLILAAGGADFLMRWVVRGAASAASSHWEELYQKLLHTEVVKAAEVYFCYNGPPFENHDRELIAALIEAAKQHAPGSRQHAVFDVHTAGNLDLPDELDAVAGWYSTALLGGLDDILELRLDFESESVLPRLLRSACARSEQRAAVVARSSRKPGRWSAVFADQEPSFAAKGLEGILDPYVRYGIGGDSGGPAVIVVRDPGRDARSQTQSVLVERVLAEQKHLPGAVIALLGCYAEGDLKDFCKTERLEFLHFHGLLELRYFLLRLNSDHELALAANPGRKLSRSEADLYTRYEAAIDQLGTKCGIDHPRHSDFLVHEHSLKACIEMLRRHGETGKERAELSRVVEQLNRLAKDVLGVTFNSLVFPQGPT